MHIIVFQSKIFSKLSLHFNIKEMDASEDVSSCSEFSESFSEGNESFYSETASGIVILITPVNIMKMIFVEVYQLQWTLRIKTIMINGFR